MTQHVWLMSRSNFAIRSLKNVQKSMGSFSLPLLGTYKYIRIENCWNLLCDEIENRPVRFDLLFICIFCGKAAARVKKGKRFGMPVWLKSMKILI